ncbi:hypothetical protein HYFRA_00010744 [Hymenoscyphus fraxineus]|uniref:Uncharacterized protein n=1 Tax=Hymenoscyphus fraxineus TaxID=746836 RepID=A0A9N9PRV2_9HELO|nr:hypothetical protein HYFRA_00010744 [Hymenoscyphus fraxineus]
MANPWLDVADRNYGNVPELCEKLGYPAGPVNGRKGSIFKNSAATYRKSVSELDPTRPRCPLDADDPVAIEYARGWIEENKALFARSEAAELHGWPIWPNDEEHIVKHVAWLMCTQERFWRVNQNYFARQKSFNNQDVDTSISRSPRNPKPASSNTTGIAADQERDIVSGNTKVHLDFAYPLDGIPVMSTNWLFQPLVMSGKMIETTEVDPFVVRYFHEHNLYHTRDNAKVERFVQDTIRHYVLRRENMEWDYRVRTRCEQVIKEFAKIWKPYAKLGFGFLEDGPHGAQKTPEFEKKWSECRKRWLDTIHQGVSGHVIEWNNNPRLVHAGGASNMNGVRKREPQSANNSARSTPNNRPQGKRARLDQSNSVVKRKTGSANSIGKSSMADTITIDDTDSEEDRSNGVFQRSRNTIPPDPYLIALDEYDRYTGAQSGERKAIRTSYNSRASLPVNSSVGFSGGRASSSPQVARPSRRSIGGHMTMMAPQPKPARVAEYVYLPQDEEHVPASRAPSLPDNLHSEQNSKKSLAELIASQNLPIESTPLESKMNTMNGPSPYSSFNGTSSLPNSNGRNASLKFAIQDETGVPDDEPSSLVSKKQIYEMSLADLFIMVANKSGMSEQHLTLLTLRCQWEQASFVVSKLAGEEPWKRQKKKLNSLFVGAQGEFPEEDEFEVWVLCGDRVSKKKSLKAEDVEMGM